ncbi:MAG TPA: DAK2 domain-containing protein [Chloroflexia bacterium]|nr:DAK2 domain-containing protein [Chloroflexia bacterium]
MTTSQRDRTPTEANASPGALHHHVPNGPGDTWDGQDLKRVLNAASAWLARNIDSLNALNVFPVPDGDTGTNMALTMQAAMQSVASSPSHSCTEIASGISHGALMGARGNSGVILSQIWRGFADGIAGKERISARDMSDGLVAATATAYRAVLKPVEGTILTVVREMGEQAKAAALRSNSFTHVLEEAAKEAKASVARTPMLLEKHREAGVVDAGGQGLFVIIDGMRRYTEGEDLELVEVEGAGAAASSPTGHAQVEHGEYGYCTNFLLVGSGWEFDEVRGRIAAMGDSAVIVGDNKIVKVHIHTDTPGSVLNYATALGNLRQISITDMQEQHDEFIEMHGSKPTHGEMHPGASTSGRGPEISAAQGRIAVLAVASGAGMAQAFRSMGATAIIEGGQTMNPSTEQLLKIIESVPQDEVILLPNNSNIVLAARQTKSLTKKQVEVVPTETVPQGMAATIALNVEASLEENSKAMSRAASQVETGEVTRAIRDAKVSGLSVKEGSVIGLHNNSLVVTGEDRDQVTWDLLERMGAAERELITIYWGNDLTGEEAADFHEKVQERYPDAEVELVNGGQPLYDYIISAE